MYKRVREWKEAFLVWLAEKADRIFHISVLDAEGVNTAKEGPVHRVFCPDHHQAQFSLRTTLAVSNENVSSEVVRVPVSHPTTSSTVLLLS